MFHHWLLPFLLATTAVPPPPVPGMPARGCAAAVDDRPKTEKQELAQAKKDLRAKDPAERRAVLSRIAELGRANPEGPSKAVARFLAQGFEDEAIEVRRHAVELLREGQHPEESMLALIGALAGAGQRMAKSGGNDTPGDKRWTPGGLEQTDDALLLLEVLTAYRDDRTVNGIAAFLSKLPHNMRYSIVRESMTCLLELGGQEAWKATIQLYSEQETLGAGKHFIKLLEDAGKKLASTVPEAGPGAASRWTKWLKKNRRSIPAKLGKYAPPGASDPP